MLEIPPKTQFCCRVTKEDDGENKKIFVENYINKSTDEFIETVSQSSFFLGLKELDCLIYRDNRSTIRMPSKAMPLVAFSNVCVPVNSSDQNWKAKGFFSLVSKNSAMSKTWSLFFKHKQKLLPDIKLEFPVDFEKNDSFESIIKAATGTIASCIRDSTEYIMSNQEKIIFFVLLLIEE